MTLEAFAGDSPVEGNPFAGCAAVAVYLMRMIGTCRSPGSSVNKRFPAFVQLGFQARRRAVDVNSTKRLGEQPWLGLD
jgi:hypothetical protein